MNSCYPFVNTPLPYAYDALEPYIDEETMHLHHDRHLQISTRRRCICITTATFRHILTI